MRACACVTCVCDSCGACMCDRVLTTNHHQRLPILLSVPIKCIANASGSIRVCLCLCIILRNIDSAVGGAMRKQRTLSLSFDCFERDSPLVAITLHVSGQVCLDSQTKIFSSIVSAHYCKPKRYSNWIARPWSLNDSFSHYMLFVVVIKHEFNSDLLMGR